MTKYEEIKSSLNSIKLGLIVGLIIPFIAILFFQVGNYSKYSFIGFYMRLHELHVFSSLISLCVVPNLLVFFIFIWKSYYLSARGVIFSTIFYGIIMMIQQCIKV